MKTWSLVIAKLAEKQNGHQAEATVLAQREYSTVKKQFERSEKYLRELETARADAFINLQALEQKTQTIEQDTQQALANNQDQKAHDLAMQIAQLHLILIDSQQQVAKLDANLGDLKGILSNNRYNLFRLEQQLDTLNATIQLQQAQNQLSEQRGIRTALTSIAILRQRAAINDDEATKADTVITQKPETADAIIKRLQSHIKST